MGEGHEKVNNDVGVSGRVTITEAATLLGVHPNTVRGRVKAGLYDAEKVATEHGLTWMIDRDSLVNAPLPKDLQRAPSQMVNLEAASPTEVIQEMLRPFVEDLGRVREELGAERVRREQAERERDELRSLLEARAKPPETPQAPEAAAEEPEGTETPADVVGSQEGVERRSWWRRFFGL